MDDKKQMRDIQQVIEKSTAKVSLRDLERKGFRNVKVLKANDITELIRQAVNTVVAMQQKALGEGDADRILRESQAEFNRLMNEAKAARERETNLEESAKDAQRRAEAATREAQHEKTERERAETRTKEYSEKLLEERRQVRALEDEMAQRGGGAEAQAEVDRLRRELSQLQMEKRLLEQIEVPKLRQRTEELEADLRRAREGGPVGDEGRLEALFRGVVDEMRSRQQAPDISAIKAELSKVTDKLSEQLARQMRNEEGQMIDAGVAAETAIKTLFSYDLGVDVQSNIDSVQVKETTTEGGVKDSLSKLKNLRKGGKNKDAQ